MASNFFQITCDSKDSLYAYSISCEPDLATYPVHDQVLVERKLNEELRLLSLGPFFCKSRKLYARMRMV